MEKWKIANEKSKGSQNGVTIIRLAWRLVTWNWKSWFKEDEELRVINSGKECKWRVSVCNSTNPRIKGWCTPNWKLDVIWTRVNTRQLLVLAQLSNHTSALGTGRFFWIESAMSHHAVFSRMSAVADGTKISLNFELDRKHVRNLRHSR